MRKGSVKGDEAGRSRSEERKKERSLAAKRSLK
jgi:hypothetical protein